MKERNKYPLVYALEQYILNKAENEPDFAMTIVTNQTWDLDNTTAEYPNSIDGVTMIEFPLHKFDNYDIVLLMRQNENVVMKTNDIVGYYT